MLFMEGAIISALLSASLQVLFDRISPRMNLFEFFQRHKFDDIHLEKLKITLLQVNAMLSDAEEKQITNMFVRQWLDELTDAAYHTADLLDEINSLALAESKTPEEDRSVLDGSITKSKSRLEKMTLKQENITKHKDVLGLKESYSGKPSPRLQSTSLVEESEVYGRENDKRKILNLLLSGDVDGNDIPTVAIIGIAGVGKTTLAQLLYNDPIVKLRFTTRAWVYLSEDLDVFKVTKTIYESVTMQHCDITDLNILQVRLKSLLTGRKFLFVLDDVWNEYYGKWDVLRHSLKVGSSESRIIVTTRSQGVASTVRAIHNCHLQPLEDKDCWLVFANHAFGSHHASAPLKLKLIGQEIVKKCQGLPLAAKVLGSLLYSKAETHEWEKILNNNIWDLPNDKSDILPSLRLSYYYLSSHLKQCFAYCSIFPKGYIFDKKKLVLLWMAEGFVLQPRSDRTMEEVGIEYFHELLSKSFFQQANDRDKSCFIMHNLINELAHFASTEFCFMFEKGKPRSISKKARHFSYVRDQFDNGPDIFNALTRANFLRTFLPLSCSSSSGLCTIDMKVVSDLVLKQKRLRVLSLSHFGNIHILPDVFKSLLHLRYLDFSYTAIRELPSSIVSLCNLQTLILSHCIQLVKLPAEMTNLKNLGHLDLNSTRSLKMMPRAFGELKSLQILTNFVVSNSPEYSSISELGKLLHLRGKLSILELQNVRQDKDKENAILMDKKNVKELEFNWSNNGHHDQEPDQKPILDWLCPHENIEKLSITGYSGTSLSDWLGNSSFSNMVTLRLSDCSNCSSFPSLGNLSSLQELHVKNMPLLNIGIDFYGNSSSIIPFTSLQILKFDNMPKWINWSPLAVTGGGFPSLQELHIKKCENLIEIPNCLPSLVLLCINECWQLQFDDIMDYPKLQDLRISSCNYLKEFTLNFSGELKFLQIHDCGDLRFIKISKDLHQDLKFFQELEISECPNLEIFSGGGLPASNLTSFSVSDCKTLMLMPKQMHKLLSSLQTLNISDCPELVSFPDGGLPLSLQTLTIQNCVKLSSMPEQIHTLLRSLQTLNISGCPELVSFPGGGLPLSLETLFIKNCVNLTPQNSWGLTNMTSLTCLTIECAYANVTSFPDEDLLPASLIFLQISDFPVLEKLNLSGLQHLTLLKDLQIHSCNQLQILSDGSLPSSLSSLTITGCSLLTDRCQRDQGDYWDRISHIPIKVINGNEIH